MDQLTLPGTWVSRPDEEPPVGRWDPQVKLLNYAPHEEVPYFREAYELPADRLNETDAAISMPLKAM